MRYKNLSNQNYLEIGDKSYIWNQTVVVFWRSE